MDSNLFKTKSIEQLVGDVEHGAKALKRSLSAFDLTLLGIGGFPASDPLNLGMMGMHGEAWVNTAIQQADLLLAFGMRFDDRVTGNLKTYASQARKVHIDIDPAEIGKNVPVDVGLVGDLRDVLGTLLPGVVAGTLLTFIPAAGDYVNVQLLGTPSSSMIGNVIQSRFLVVVDYPTASALSFTLMAAILVLVLVYIRRAGTEDLV